MEYLLTTMSRTFRGITIDEDRDNLFSDFAKKTLADRYMVEGENSPQEALARAATAFADDESHAQRIYDYASKHWFMYATPILSNGGTDRGLPISCFLNTVTDSRLGLSQHYDENIWLASSGGGIGGSWGNIRSDGQNTSSGSRSTGSIPFLHVVDSQMLAFNQGTCYTKDHEVLTERGWVKFEDLRDNGNGLTYLVQVSETGEPSLTRLHEKNIVREDYDGEVVSFFVEGKEILKVTSNHKMVVRREGCWDLVPASEVEYNERNLFPVSVLGDMKKWEKWESGIKPIYYPPFRRFTPDEFWNKIGHFEDLGSFHYHQLPDLFDQEYIHFFDGVLSFLPSDPNSWENIIFGSLISWNGLIYTDYVPAIDHLQHLAAFSGHQVLYQELSSQERKDLILTLKEEKFSFDDTFLLKEETPVFKVSLNENCNQIIHVEKKVSREKCKVYCVEVPHKRLIVRYNGFVSICGNTRRGSYAAYQDISHPEIQEFIGMRKPTGGDLHRKCLNLHHGVNIPNTFMEILERCSSGPGNDDSWELKDPHSGTVTEVVSAPALWAKLLETRVATGEPYVHFIDHANDGLPEPQKKMGLRINHSNLCTEIQEATDALRTAVCCLSSLNLAKWPEWKDTPIVRDLIRLLDNVLEVFIWSIFSPEKKKDLESLSYTYDIKMRNSGGKLSEAEEREFLTWMGRLCNPKMEGLKKAAFSAYRERSLGLGAMGFHSLLQKMRIPFESPMAIGLNRTIFKHIKSQAVEESMLLAVERGEAPDLKGTGKRNAHLMAIAPNASSSSLCGEVSPSGEPSRAMAFTAKTLSGSFLQKNAYLEELLLEKVPEEKERKKIWKSIIANTGSVQHLDCLDEWEKMVFKTAMEIDQRWVIEHAAARQEFICQGQSINLFFRPDEEISYLHEVHFLAWKKGLKSLYYCRSEAPERAENVETKVERSKIDTEGCISCEG